MNYNLAQLGILESTTISGNKLLSRAELQAITDSTVSSGVALYGDDILCLDLNLGKRIVIEQIKYVFDSVTSSGTVLSSINMFYKNYENESWNDLGISICNGYYGLTSVSGLEPQYLRLVHTISGTSISGTLLEFYVANNDDIVGFGLDGNQTTKELSPTPEGYSQVFNVDVYNNYSKSVNAHAVITDVDGSELLEIGSTGSSFVSVTGNQIDLSKCSLSNLEYTSADVRLSSKSDGLNYLRTTSVGDPYRMVCRWNVGGTGSFFTEMYYAKSYVFRKYVILTDSEVVCANPPVPINASTHLTYDWENDFIYLIARKDSSTTSLYRYDPKHDSWSSELLTYNTGSANDTNCNNLPAVVFVPSGVFSDGLASLCTVTVDGGDHKSNFYRIKLPSLSMETLNLGCPWESTTSNLYNLSNIFGYYNGNIYWLHGYTPHFINIYSIRDNTWTYLDITYIPKDSGFNSDFLYTYNSSGGCSNDRFYFCDSTLDYVLIYFDLNTHRLKRDYYYDNFYATVNTVTYHSVCPNINNEDVFILRSTHEGLYWYAENKTYKPKGELQTPVLNTVENSYLRIKKYLPANTFISESEGVFNNTVQVRYSNEFEDRFIVGVVRLSHSSSEDSVYFYNNFSEYLDSLVNHYYDETNLRFSVAFNGNYWFIAKSDDGGSNSHGNDPYIYIYSKTYSLLRSKRLYDVNATYQAWYVPKHIIPDDSNGFWIIFGKGNYSTGQNYIKHYNFNLDEIGSREIQQWKAYDGCTDGHLGLWYTDTNDNKLYKLDTNGNVVLEVSIQDPRGCCEDGNGGVFVLSQYDLSLRHYSSNGTLLSTYYGDWYTPKYAVSDDSGGVWFIDREDNKLKHVNSNGVLVHSIQGQDPDYLCKDGIGGIWYVTDSYHRIIHINKNGVEDYNFYKSNLKSYAVGCRYIGAGERLPDANDAEWTNLEWEALSLDNHILSNKKYCQFKITLNTENPYVSPIIYSLNMPEVVDINNIPSGSSKKLYLRTNIPSEQLFQVKEVPVRVWFDLE